jgi:hypothetical protein
MRAIYNHSFADPWLKVAEQLKRRYAIEPVYWIGYADDDSARLVRRTFPEAVYHANFDAWKGVFPDGVAENAWSSTLDPEDYRHYAEYELQALQLMDRMDFDWRSFSYAERRLLFRKFIRCWTYVVDHYGIDALISPNIPHTSFDFPLYLVCRRKGIKTISFMNTPFMKSGRIIAVSDLYHLPERIKKAFEQKQKAGSRTPLSEDTDAYLSRVNQNYNAAKPENFKEYNRHHKRKPSVFLTVRKFLYELLGKDSPWRGRDGWLVRGVPNYHKPNGIEVERTPVRQKLPVYSVKIFRRILYLKRLEAEYRRLAVRPDLGRKYVIMGLHYQPESTTSPRAGLFADQMYVLELIARHLPMDWAIYVKENPKQFNPIAEGNTGRPMRFYRDALKIPRVSFVPNDMDPFILIDGALAVFTVTGTIGWEGMARGKPVVSFGPSWYEHFFPGVMRIAKGSDLDDVRAFIEHYAYDEASLHRYLKTIEEQSICAYFRKGLKQVTGISEAESIEALTACVSSHFDLEAFKGT